MIGSFIWFGTKRGFNHPEVAGVSICIVDNAIQDIDYLTSTSSSKKEMDSFGDVKDLLIDLKNSLSKVK